MTDTELRLEMQGEIDGLKIIVSSLLHALPDQRPFAFRFRELEVLARKQNALPLDPRDATLVPDADGKLRCSGRDRLFAVNSTAAVWA